MQLEIFKKYVLVCINSDDSSYFNAYCTDNFCQFVDAIDLNKEEILLY